jgi:hypothetical protein
MIPYLINIAAETPERIEMRPLTLIAVCTSLSERSGKTAVAISSTAGKTEVFKV